MTAPERATAAWLEEQFGGHKELLHRLLDEGLIDRRRAERCAIRAEVERLYHVGMGRCEAMEQTARNYCCSYEKVRAAVYPKRI